jgi:hypothetical protein
MSDSAREWTDLIVGERMQVDKEFDEKVAASNFSRQQWGLIMTAVEFDIEQPADPEGARLVADTRKVETILPELDNMESQAPMAGGSGSAGGSGRGGSGGSGGLFSGIKSALGLGDGDGKREQLAAAEELTQMYADDLQQKLESRGKWERIRTVASEDGE